MPALTVAFVTGTPAEHSAASAAPDSSGSAGSASASGSPSARSNVQPPSVCWLLSTTVTDWSSSACGTRTLLVVVFASASASSAKIVPLKFVGVP